MVQYVGCSNGPTYLPGGSNFAAGALGEPLTGYNRRFNGLQMDGPLAVRSIRATWRWWTLNMRCVGRTHLRKHARTTRSIPHVYRLPVQ